MATKYCTLGAGSGDGLTPETAWGTLAEAFAECADGDHIICSGTFNEVVTLGANINGKTVTFDGQGTAAWHYAPASANATVMMTIGSGADGFTIHFVGMDITRTQTNATTRVILNSNAGGAEKTLTFTGLTIDTERQFILQNAGGSADKINLTFTDCLIRHGAQVVNQAASRYYGDITLVRCECRKSLGAATAGQGGPFNFSGSTNTVDSVTMTDCDVYLEGTLDTQKIMDTGSKAVTVSLSRCKFFYTVAAMTASSAQVLINCSGPLSIVDCKFYDLLSLGTARGYTGAQHWVDLTGASTVVFTGNTVSAFAATANNAGATAVMISLGAAGVLTYAGNRVTSGSAGEYIRNTAAGAVFEYRGNRVVCDNFAATVNFPTAVRLGESPNPDAAATHSFGACVIEDNVVDVRVGANVGIGLLLGRNVGAPTGTKTRFKRNTILGTPYANLGSGVGQIALYCMGRNLDCQRNRVFGRSALTFIGLQDSIVRYNSAAYDTLNTGKGLLNINGHGEVEQANNVIQFNVCDVADVVAGSAVVYVDANNTVDLTDVVVDSNWYACPSEDNVGELDSTSYANLTALIAGWDAKDTALGGWSGVAGNDVHSILSSAGVFRNPAAGDFTPMRFLNRWGAVPWPEPGRGAARAGSGTLGPTMQAGRRRQRIG